MTVILFSINGHIRTIVNRCIDNKCKMFKSFSSFIEKDDSSIADLYIIDNNLKKSQENILKSLILLDNKSPIICLYNSKEEEYHKFGSSLLYISKPFFQTSINEAMCLLNIKKENNIEVKDKKLISDDLLIGSSEEMKKVRHELSIIGKENYPTYIFGETGTGKELAARTLHANSCRKSQQMVCVNSSLLNSSLADSVLFGHAKGSYTGADSTKSGLVEKANDTTLFLDEIENLNLLSQAKLLRLLENGEYRRIGDERQLHSNFRLVTASNMDIAKLIEQKSFRRDFFFRIALFSIKIPPLRDHKEDLKELVEYYYCSINESRPLEDTFIERLNDYDFPGNVRELNGILERSRVFSLNSTLELKF